MTSNTIEGTILGLDVGSRRIGVARISTFARLSEPLDHIDTKKSDVQASIMAAIAEHDAQAIVVGLPRGLDGQETAQTAYARNFAAELEQYAGIPVHMCDEAGTTKEAEERVGTKDISVDSMAAAIIVEDFVELLNSGRIPS